MSVDAPKSFGAGGLQVKTVTLTPGQMLAGADIELVPGVPNKDIVVFAVYGTLGNGTTDWNGGSLNIYTGHGDLFWCNLNTFVTPGPDVNFYCGLQSPNGGTGVQTDQTGVSIFCTPVGFAPAGGDKAITLNVFYQLL